LYNRVVVPAKPVETQTVEEGLSWQRREGSGRRDGSEATEAPIWRLDGEEYLERCDPWPLNPGGELLLGVKLASPEGVAHCEDSAKVGRAHSGRTSQALGPSPRP
jgi:hypothetical protein